MHAHRDPRVEQANTAIRHFIESLPSGRIRLADRPEYERLVAVWLDALEGRGRGEAR